MYETYIASSARTKHDLYHLRYQIFTTEQRKFRNTADHQRQILLDAVDEHAEHYCLEADGVLIGSMRQLHGVEHVPPALAANLSLERFSGFPGSSLSFSGRLLILPSYRGSPALLDLVRFAFQRARALGSLFDFIFCNPHLVRMYEALGYRRYRPYFEDPGLGFQVPMVLVTDDVIHLRAIRSPFARLPSGAARSSETADWFKSAFPDYQHFTSPAVVGPEVFASILSRKVNEAAIELFSDLSPDQINGVIEMSSHLKVSAHTRLVRKGDWGEELFLNIEGVAEARSSSEHGPARILGTLGRGDVFGEMAVFTRRPRSADVIAQTDLEVIFFDRTTLEKLLTRKPEVGGRLLFNLCRLISERFQERELDGDDHGPNA